MQFAAWYAIIVGLLMIGQWGFFLVTDNVPVKTAIEVIDALAPQYGMMGAVQE